MKIYTFLIVLFSTALLYSQDDVKDSTSWLLQHRIDPEMDVESLSTAKEAEVLIKTLLDVKQLLEDEIGPLEYKRKTDGLTKKQEEFLAYLKSNRLVLNELLKRVEEKRQKLNDNT